MNALDTLIRLRRDALDRRRQVLASLDERRAIVVERQEALEARILDEKAVANADATLLFIYDGFARKAIQDREELSRAAEDLDSEIEAAAEDLRHAFSELKKFEIAREQKERHEQIEADRRERRVGDELALSRFRHAQRAGDGD